MRRVNNSIAHLINFRPYKITIHSNKTFLIESSSLCEFSNMKRDINFKALLDGSPPEDETVLALLAPYAYALSEFIVQQDGVKVAETFNKDYALFFINKLKLNIGFLNANGTIVNFTASLEKLVRTKYGINEIKGRNIRDIIYEFPSEIEEALRKNLKGQSVRLAEVLMRITADKTVWISWESFPWFAADKKIKGIFFFCKDISKERKLELDLSRLYSRAELLSRFALIFSHDLIQPLRQISTYVSILESELEAIKGKTDVVDQTVGSLKRCISKTKEVCEGIVLYCKNGSLTVNREPVRLQDVMNMTLEICAERPEIIVKDSTPKDLILNMNKTSLLQLFQNLLDNAIKHSTTRPFEITFSGRDLENGYYEFSLHNNGWSGELMSPDKVFDAFSSNYEDGAGLGLMICRKIVEAYGGEMSFISNPNDGTKINFSLPMYEIPTQETVITTLCKN